MSDRSVMAQGGARGDPARAGQSAPPGASGASGGVRAQWPVPVSAGLVVIGAIFVQSGAGIAYRLFSTVPPAAVTTLRLWGAAVIMLAVGGRGVVAACAAAIRDRSWSATGTACAFGIALGFMNFCIYQSFARIPLGIAVTIEFLGPLAVAVAGSRRPRDLVWVGIAAGGVVLLGRGGHGHMNLAGVAFGVGSAVAWAAYILLSKATGRRFPGGSGLALAMCVAALTVTVPGTLAGGTAMFRPALLATGAAIGLLSSVIPYWLELEVLRRLPARVFGVWMSAEPAVAALMGLIMLGQRLSLPEWGAICCVMLACAGAALALPWGRA